MLVSHVPIVTIVTLALGSLLGAAQPALQPRKAEIVFNPKILTPVRGDTWMHGETRNVTW
jgi:hypothetical protein